ncbi:hypothetical protein LTR62_000527 [Meristemomyces frigidus]|uniref:GIY-YIG domain-containing protein n=1 Tax=Meristemomyces frigidus TaxID=1508187 RepID=A0AAN7TCZ1_9PEZI|nr:hypothetical protein LTR62_000527 [Meristemomyces frigidus]
MTVKAPSTPHPVRRRNQHNGKATGGAHRTSKDSLRPWEMTCLVHGFPSKIAALQFEWAWQNAHTTRHVTAEARITQARSNIRVSPKTGRVKKKPVRPRMGLSERLGNLHLLLHSSSFERWPLRVTFYALDVHRTWDRWTRQHVVDSLRPGIEVKLDPSATEKARPEEAANSETALSGISALDVGYGGLKLQLEKSKRIFDEAEWLQCDCCHQVVPAAGDLTLVCSTEGCDAVFHLDCLSTAFLEAEGNEDAMVPTSGACPSCGIELQWAELAKELSLRLRGETEIKALYKKRRAKKGEVSAGDSVSDDDDIGSDLDVVDIGDEDIWHELPATSEVEAVATRGNPTPVVKKRRKKTGNKAVPPVAVSNFEPAEPTEPERIIEESDWEGAEMIT